MIVVPLVDGRTLVDRQALAALLQRSPETIRRRCTPAACCATTRAVLYDAEVAQRELAQVPRRGVPEAA